MNNGKILCLQRFMRQVIGPIFKKYIHNYRGRVRRDFAGFLGQHCDISATVPHLSLWGLMDASRGAGASRYKTWSQLPEKLNTVFEEIHKAPDWETWLMFSVCPQAAAVCWGTWSECTSPKWTHFPPKNDLENACIWSAEKLGYQLNFMHLPA